MRSQERPEVMVEKPKTMAVKERREPQTMGLPVLLAGFGTTLGVAFEGVGKALVETIWVPHLGGDNSGAGPKIELICHGSDARGLLLSWIELLLYAMDARQAAFLGIQVKIRDDRHLHAIADVRPFLGRARGWPQEVDTASVYVRQDDPPLWRAGCQITLAPHPIHGLGLSS